MREREVTREGNACCAKRKRLVGDFEHAPQPPRFFAPGTEKGGPCAPYAGGEARVPVAYASYIRTYVRAPLYAAARTRASRSGESIGEKRERVRAAHSSVSSSLILDYEPLRTLLFREPGDSESGGIYCHRNVSEICEGG